VGKTVRILSIDGGGIRGVIPAVILREVEKATRTPIAKLFDVIAGTSTGGVMTLLFTKRQEAASDQPMYTADDVVNLYVQHGKHMFDRSALYVIESADGLCASKYPESSVVNTLSAYLDKGEKSEIKDALTDVLLTSYEIDRRQAVYFTRRRARADADWNFTMLDAARGTAAAPTYFPPVEVTGVNGVQTFHLIDGGLVANNPASCAWGEARTLFRDHTELVLLSLGTGEFEAPIEYDKAKDWGLTGWAPHIIDVLFDGSSQGVDDSMSDGFPPDDYFRFQVQVPKQNDDMDNSAPQNIQRLEELTRTMLDQQSVRFQQACDRLVGLKVTAHA
jgi:patatin-like phospholipase/acyl hydrolase